MAERSHCEAELRERKLDQTGSEVTRKGRLSKESGSSSGSHEKDTLYDLQEKLDDSLAVAECVLDQILYETANGFEARLTVSPCR